MMAINATAGDTTIKNAPEGVPENLAFWWQGGRSGHTDTTKVQLGTAHVSKSQPTS